MPAKSQKQQQSAAIALAAKRGEKDKEDLQGSALDMYESMSESELEEYASSSGENLPEKKDDSDNKKQGSEDNILNQFLEQKQQDQQGIHKHAEEIIDYRLRKLAQ